jgi:hypothetical protein
MGIETGGGVSGWHEGCSLRREVSPIHTEKRVAK